MKADRNVVQRHQYAAAPCALLHFQKSIVLHLSPGSSTIQATKPCLEEMLSWQIIGVVRHCESRMNIICTPGVAQVVPCPVLLSYLFCI